MHDSCVFVSFVVFSSNANNDRKKTKKFVVLKTEKLYIPGHVIEIDREYCMISGVRNVLYQFFFSQHDDTQVNKTGKAFSIKAIVGRDFMLKNPSHQMDYQETPILFDEEK